MKGEAGYPVRLQFTKVGKVRFVSHRDVARAFERAFRIDQLPLAFTQGFSPRPKVSFGLALSVGHESEAEYLDVELTEPVDVETLPTALSEALPVGIDVRAAAPLADRAPSLQEAITEIEYRTEVVDGSGASPSQDAVRRAVRAALDADALYITRVRKGVESNDDVRPVIRDLSVVDAGDHVALDLRLATQPRVPRPSEVIAAVDAAAGGLGLTEWRARRTHQWIERCRRAAVTTDGRCAPRPPGGARLMREGFHVRRDDHHGPSGPRAQFRRR